MVGMITIILPGYSPHNKDWAYDVKDNLNLNHEILVHEWGHWQKGSFSMPKEIESLLSEIGDKKVNIIAKSVGTRVTMVLVPKIIDQINKIILCGIPTKGKNEATRKLYRTGLSYLNANNAICFQNTQDPFAPYEIIKDFVGELNPEISIIEKERHDHEYPYFSDFENFLKK